MKNHSRRSFLKATVGSGVGLAIFPSILPARLFGADAPSKKIQVAQIGCGRMGRSDMGNVMTEPLARVVAVCDLDSHRLAAGKKMAEDFYTERGEAGVNIKTFHDYQEILASPEIDAVVVTVPDHSHARLAIAAAIAGKHVYVQKPVTYSIVEAIGLRRAVEAKKIILQTGSQQRSERPWGSFRKASEAVRNGRIGQLRTINIGVGLDKASGHAPAPMPVPPNLDYEKWLGSAPEQPYMERRVHPQGSLEGRPGWITTEDFGLGMITNWGAHHVDIAQWAMGQELGGPLTVESHAEFMQHDAWTVHTTYHVEMLYPNNVQMILDNTFETGIRFEGDEGWIFCTRSEEKATASDPNAPLNREALLPLRASDKKILEPLDENAFRWMPSKTQHGNWLESIVANREPIAPIQQSARSLEACAAAWIGMKLKRKLQWDAAAEMFVGDDAANALRGRQARKPEYDFELMMKKAGLV
jgi:predicted dehydrogenase